jgi:excisionase family DNA binding protein
MTEKAAGSRGPAERKPKRKSRQAAVSTADGDLAVVLSAVEALSPTYLRSLRQYFEKIQERKPGELVVLADVPGSHVGEKIVLATPNTSKHERILNFSVEPKALAGNLLTIKIGERENTGPVAIALSPSGSDDSASDETGHRFLDLADVNGEAQTVPQFTRAKLRAMEPEVKLRRAFESIRNRMLREGLSTPEAASRLGLTPEGTRRKAARGDLLALKLGRDYRFPRWQFEDRNADGIVRGVSDVIKVSVLDPLELAAWFETKMEALEGRSPVEALASGDLEDVIAAAEAAGVS